jgi:UDP-glucose 4-epimerase
VYGDGSQTRDFTYVGTVARVITKAVTGRVSSNEPVNLAYGTRTSLNELVGLLEELLGRSVQRREHPARAGDVPHSQADSTRLKQLFPDVEPDPLEEALAATLRWFREMSVQQPGT